MDGDSHFPPRKGGVLSALHSRASLRIFVVCISLFSAVGCLDRDKGGKVFQKDSSSCSASAIPNQFIVHFKNGTYQVFSGMTREELLEQVVEPRIDEIRRVDYDRVLNLPQETAETFASFDDGGGSDWGVAATGAPEAWAQGIKGAGAVVAVIDTGIDYNHIQLNSQIARNEGEAGMDAQNNDKRFNGIDDDQNGYKDDWLGYNFVYDDGNPDDSGSHGTHVSGIIAAAHLEGEPVQGMAPDAKLVPIAFIGGPTGGSISAALVAIDYALARGAHVINASWGGVLCAPALGEKIHSLSEEGVVFVAAAGNNGFNIEQMIEFPAAFNAALQITVGSIGRAFGMADHSNFGHTFVHIFSPGVEILSTLPGNSFGASTGTSMAAPFVSGAVALLKSHRPAATGAQLKKALLAGVIKNKSYANSSSGRLDMVGALEEIERLVPAPIPPQNRRAQNPSEPLDQTFDLQ